MRARPSSQSKIQNENDRTAQRIALGQLDQFRPVRPRTKQIPRCIAVRAAFPSRPRTLLAECDSGLPIDFASVAYTKDENE